jgi:class 3 adenylate cyclase
MAIFEGKGEEIKAIRAAVEIQRYCDALNVARAAAGEKQIHIGIGLNNGDVIMGNIGLF